MICHYIKKKNCRHILGIIIDNSMCSLFVDNHGGMLLLITKIGHIMQTDLISANGLTPYYQRNPKITKFFFKVRPFFLHISKCRIICRHSNNVILTFVLCMVIHKLRYVFAHEHSLQTWNDGNIMKNLLRHLFCYLISSISTYLTFHTFYCKFMLIIIYNIVIGACMNCFIMNSNFFHDGR